MNILELAIARQMSGGGGGGGGVSSWDELTGKPFDANNIIKPEALPEGYPYKEGIKTEIVWDGNAEGKVNVEINGEVIFTKVSDATPSVDELSPMYAQTVDEHNAGNDPTELNAADIMTGNGCIYIPIGGAPTIVIAHEPNASINMGQMSLVFPEAGVYFGPIGHYGVTGYFCYGSETIHPMAPEFLPAGVGVPTVTADDNGKFLRVVNGAWVAVALESAEGGSF